MGKGRAIAFEGVDGAGKSTALALVAERLRERGVRVFLPRFGKDHASPAVRSIREITRDRRHVELDPRTELMLYCAREAQVLAELVRPAVERGETVLIDRSLLTPEVLGRARGLSEETCRLVTGVASAGVEPDLTLVFDVHPRTSRLRKRLERIRKRSEERGGRKGLAGSAFKEHVRALYLELAAARGHRVLHAERATPQVLAERALQVIERGPRVDVGESALDRVPIWQLSRDLELMQALEPLPLPVALLLGAGLAATRELRLRALDAEPALCAYTLDFDDPLRAHAARQEPEYALRGLAGRPLEGPADLRFTLLPRVPAACIAALKHLSDAESDRLRETHADEHPNAVLSSLAYREDEPAMRLRARCYAVGRDRARAVSLQGCVSEDAWRLRAELFERDPVYGLQSLRGTSDARGDRLLERYAAFAPATVLEGLGGRSDEPAYRMRDALFETGREVIDSIRGLDDDAASALRERALPRWPSTVAHSLMRLPDDARTRAIAARCAASAAGDVHVLRRLQALREQALWPPWMASRKAAQVEGEVL
jgi:dTMP kinase